MQYTKYIIYAAMILYVIIMVSIPFRLKKQDEDFRRKVKEQGSAFWIREVSIFILAASIIVLCLFIHFEVIPTIVLCGCGVIGAYMAVQELFLKEEGRS